MRENFDFQAVATAGPHVWVAGSPGTRVFHSADGGHSWQPLATGQNAPLRAITFVDDEHGFAAGDLGTILATSDGGRTWQVQRRGGERAAMLLALAGETDVPLELVGKLGAEEGYLTAVSLLHPALDDGRRAIARSAAARRGDGDQRRLAVSARRAMTARSRPTNCSPTLNRANDGRAVERLERYLVRQLRMWRPDVVVTHRIAQPEIDPLGVARRAVGRPVAARGRRSESVFRAGDRRRARAVASEEGLRRAAGGLARRRSDHDRASSRRGSARRSPIGPSRRGGSFMPTQTAAPEAIELQLKARERPARTARVARRVCRHPTHARRRRAAAIGESAERRRRQAAPARHAPATDADAHRAVARQRGLGRASRRSHRRLDPASAGELLFELAEGYRAAGKLDLAADTYYARSPAVAGHPLVEPALRGWCSFTRAAKRPSGSPTATRRTIASCRRQTADRPTRCSRRARSPRCRRAAPVIGLSRDNRLERAAALGQYLEQARPSLFAEPSIRFPLVVAQRQLGFANPAQRYFLTLRSLPENDPWRRCGQTEEWFAKSGDSPPPKKLGNCRRAAERPHLDGNSTSRSGRSADRLQLARRRTEPEQTARRQIVHPTVRFAYDHEFLYVAVECPKATDVDYAPDDRPRPRDADLSAHDRVTCGSTSTATTPRRSN